ncbi:hypothetical protein PN480_01400 [Dolichospermum circinale CS-1225]|nr:hypothetical protein [Dolichospermum circinale CS-1225]
MTREQGTGNREQGRGFRQLYFLLLMSFFSVHLLRMGENRGNNVES